MARDRSDMEVFVSLATLIPQTLVRFRQAVIASWLVVIALAMLVRVSFTQPAVSLIEGLGWLMLASVPAIVLLSVFRGAPRTMAQLLYDTDHPAEPALAVITRK